MKHSLTSPHAPLSRLLASVAGLLVAALVLAWTVVAAPSASAATVPSGAVWVSTSGSDSGKGTLASPYRTIAKAVDVAKAGRTIVLKGGTYREGRINVSRDDITIMSAPGERAVLSGADWINPSRWVKDGSAWKVTGDFQNFCTVCTTNADPALEGMAAHPEQVFLDSAPLTQVATRAEVRPGTFYVEDRTPTTLNVAGNNTKGYDVGAQDRVTYYVGTDPTSHSATISQRARALTVSGKGFKLLDVTLTQYAPVQVWSFNDPVMGYDAGPAPLVVSGDDATIEDVLVTRTAGGYAMHVGGDNVIVRDSSFTKNGGTGINVNRADGTSIEDSTIGSNNLAGFITVGCTDYCTMAQIKVTSTDSFTFRDNVVDSSGSGIVAATPANAAVLRTKGIWLDESSTNAVVTDNYFTNQGVAILFEISSRAIIASNVIEASGTGIMVSGADHARIYNNTISRTWQPLLIREDGRFDGCYTVDAKTGACTRSSAYAQQVGVTWDTTNTEIYNNIVSSRPTSGTSSERSSVPALVSVKMGPDRDGTDQPIGNALDGLDYNAYYRSSLANDPYVLMWIPSDKNLLGRAFLARTADVATSSLVTSRVAGREAHSLDLLGSPSANPYFVREASGDASYNTSDYTLKAGSPAKGAGKALPADVAKAIDPSGTTVASGTAVDMGALVNARMSSGK